jgi:hypothetical protein
MFQLTQVFKTDLIFNSTFFRFNSQIKGSPTQRRRNNNFDDGLVATIVPPNTNYSELLVYDSLPLVENIDSVKVSLMR